VVSSRPTAPLLEGRFVVRTFHPEDLAAIEPQAAQALDIPRHARLEYGRQFAESGSAFTVWEVFERPIASLLEGGAPDMPPAPLFCGGHLRRHPGYATLWGLFGVGHARAKLFLLRRVRHYLSGLSERRVDAQVAADNGAACRWAQLLGLTEEARHRAAMPDGGDMVIFTRLRDAG
jgi:hypothetical protein